jgi:osmotically-inducible protein OsmY
MAERYSERGGRRWDDQRRGSDREWGYGSRAGDYSREYRGQERRGDDRGFLDRAGDEVRSWFGDEDAQRRRMRDERDDDRGERRDSGSREPYRGRSEWDFDPREWSRQWGYVEGRGSGERGRDWNRGGRAEYDRGWGSEAARGTSGWGSAGEGYFGGYGAYGRERERSRESDWGGQGPGGFGVYRGTLSEQRESGGPWRGDRDRGPFAGGEPHGSGRYSGRGPRSYQRSDERIREEVCERLAHHPDIDATDIDIRVQSGEVTLEGHVTDRWAKRWAEDVAEGIFGVKEVHNQIRVQQLQPGQEQREGQQERPQQQQQQRGPWAA